MDSTFAELLEKKTPKTNPYIMNGLASYYMDNAKTYIEDVFKSTSKSYPAGLKFISCELSTPYEEYNMVTKVRNNERNIDLARSDLYTIRCKFTFEDAPLPDRYIYLPFVDDSGILHLNGSKYYVTPILSDKVISPGIDSVFVRLLRDKIIFKMCYQTILVNDESKPCVVVWSSIYRRNTNSKNKVQATTGANTTVAHYLFAKYGFTEAFKKYAGFVPVIGKNDINSESYPDDCWIIIKSTQVKPRTYIGANYTGSELRLAIPKNMWNKNTEALVAGFFYIADHFPSLVHQEMLDNTPMWMILMGHIVFSGHFGHNKLFTNISEHFMSLADYADDKAKEKLLEIGYKVEDFYDLLALIMTEFNDLILKSDHNHNTMYEKSLEILYYLLLKITTGIFLMNFELNKTVSKKPLTAKDIEKIMNQKLKPRDIFDSTNKGIVLENVSYSGDCKYATITSKIVKQEGSSGKKKKTGRTAVGESQHIDVSMLEAGSPLYLSKSNPTPTNRINPYTIIDLETATIKQNPKFIETIQKTEMQLKGIG